MIIIYSCFGGAHSSPVAAAIHLGRLPSHRLPTDEELLSIDGFDRTTSDDYGRLRHVGADEAGHRIYVLGRGPGASAVERAFFFGYALAGGAGGEVRFVHTLPCVNAAMRIGGYLSRGLGLPALGRPLVLSGTRRAYPRLVELVNSVKASLKHTES